MSRFVLSIVTALAFSVGMAVAQTNSTPGAQGTQSAAPGEQQQAPNQPSMNEQSNPQMSPTDQNSGNTGSHAEKGEHKLKGCVQSQGGQSTLETRKGKEIALTGQDVSAHAGHEVELMGSWESGGNAGMSQSSTGASSEKTFNVTDVKMISDTCASKSKGNSGANSGYGTGSGSGSGTGSSGGSTTQPQ